IPWLPEALTTAMDAQAVRRAFDGAVGSDGGGFSRADVDALAEAAQAPGAMTAMINYYRANAAVLPVWARMRRPPIDAPVLVVWGDRDPYLDTSLAKASRALGPDVAVDLLP